MPNSYLIPGLGLGPQIVKWIVIHADPSVYDTKTDPERFTFREAIAHLADWEDILLQRMQQAANKPGSMVMAYDETVRAIQQNYASTEPASEAANWASRRATTIKFLESASPEIWESKMIHPERGEMTVYDLANAELGHDTYHVEHLIHFLH